MSRPPCRVRRRLCRSDANEAAEDRLGLGRTETNGRHVFDHLIVLLADQFPIDRFRQDGLQVGVRIRSSRIGSREFLCRDP